jgi:hypothetical protein
MQAAAQAAGYSGDPRRCFLTGYRLGAANLATFLPATRIFLLAAVNPFEKTKGIDIMKER